MDFIKLRCIEFTKQNKTKQNKKGCLGGSVGYVSDFGSGHDLTTCGFEPHCRAVLTAQNPEPASDSVSPSLSAPPPLELALSLSLSLKNKH